MRRRLFAILAVFSLLLCLFSALIWARSYGVADEVTWKRAEGTRSVETKGGLVTLRWDLSAFAQQPKEQPGLSMKHTPKSPTQLATWASWDTIDPILLMCSEQGEIFAYQQRGEFTWIKKDRPLSGAYMARAVAPLWSVTTAAGVLPLAWMGFAVVARTRGKYAARLNCCRRCGYDLRATPERCPECGEIAFAKGVQAA